MDVTDNTVVATCNVGLNVAAGRFVRVLRNRVVSASQLPDGTRELFFVYATKTATRYRELEPLMSLIEPLSGMKAAVAYSLR